MKYLLFLIGLAMLLVAIIIQSLADTSIHEIESLILLLIASVWLCCSAIIGAMGKAKDETVKSINGLKVFLSLPYRKK